MALTQDIIDDIKKREQPIVTPVTGMRTPTTPIKPFDPRAQAYKSIGNAVFNVGEGASKIGADVIDLPINTVAGVYNNVVAAPVRAMGGNLPYMDNDYPMARTGAMIDNALPSFSPSASVAAAPVTMAPAAAAPKPLDPQNSSNGYIPSLLQTTPAIGGMNPPAQAPVRKIVDKDGNVTYTNNPSQPGGTVVNFDDPKPGLSIIGDDRTAGMTRAQSDAYWQSQSDAVDQRAQNDIAARDAQNLTASPNESIGDMISRRENRAVYEKRLTESGRNMAQLANSRLLGENALAVAGMQGQASMAKQSAADRAAMERTQLTEGAKMYLGMPKAQQDIIRAKAMAGQLSPEDQANWVIAEKAMKPGNDYSGFIDQNTGNLNVLNKDTGGVRYTSQLGELENRLQPYKTATNGMSVVQVQAYLDAHPQYIPLVKEQQRLIGQK